MFKPSFWKVSLWMFLVLSASVALQAADEHAPGRNVADMTFAAVPGMPTCTTASVQSGDPSSGGSILVARIKTGCVIPWHWHTPTESLMMVKGTARAEVKDGETFVLKAGGFAQMPSKHVHQFTCLSECLMYVSSDAAFDIHYVDGGGGELDPAAALKKSGETAAAMPK